MSTSDHELLQEYANAGSHAAFEELVRRHINLVYASARRCCRDPHMAEDIAQQVFTLLAQKAQRIGGNVVISGWLYRTARRVSFQMLRTDSRRQKRERTAAETAVSPDAAEAWSTIEPLLDHAMESLSQPDHDAIVLRYFEGKSLREIGTVFGTTEDAAQKRVARALEKLKCLLQREGVCVALPALGAAMAASSAPAAPAGMAVSTAASALLGTPSPELVPVLKTLASARTWLAASAVVVVGTAVVVLSNNNSRLINPGAAFTSNVNANIETGIPQRLFPTPTRANAAPATVFEIVYADDLALFAANLRSIRCPELTVRDILIADVQRRYADQEELLRPRPADHVAFMWSAATLESKLLERREQAAAIARKKAELLQQALGYEVPVPAPVYAMTFMEQQIEERLTGTSAGARETFRRAQDRYHAGIRALLDRTKGFWLEDDVAELNGLKEAFRRELDGLNTEAAEPETPARLHGTGDVPRQPAGGRSFRFDWAAIECPDYKLYAANLRAVGFPEGLVRSIVMADMDAMFASREAPLKLKRVAHDAPLSVRQGSPTPEIEAGIRLLRELHREKQAALQEILGIEVPREVLRTPTSRNYEACEYALSLLEPRKREAVQTALEDFWMADDANKGRRDYVEAYRLLREQWAEQVQAFLTADEWERFQMQTMPPGTELARRIVGMEPSETEMVTMFRLAYQCWIESGGVYGLWRAIPVPPEQIEAAERKLEAGFRQVLGEDRYLDYRMAVTETGQQLRNLAARFELPRSSLVEAFLLQQEVEELSKQAAVKSASPDNAARDLQMRVNELNHSTALLLGPSVWNAWLDGKDRKVSLNPE